MIETICPNCGNIKSFDEIHKGRKFKCLNCGEPVTITNIGSQLITEPDQNKNFFANAILLKEERAKNESENRIKRIKSIIYLCVGIFFLVMSFSALMSIELVWCVIFLIPGIWLLRKRKKIKKKSV